MMGNSSIVTCDTSSAGVKNSSSGYWVILALAISAFGIGTAEFVMAGVLPNIANALKSFNYMSNQSKEIA